MSEASRAAGRENFWLDVLNGSRRGAQFSALRGALYGASALYSGGLAVYLGLERLGIRKRLKLSNRVISIGNISSGGTGKTPMTQYLVDKLVADEFKPVVLSRGHGGSLSNHPTQVSDDGGSVMHGAAEAGDEAVALAHLLPGTPVFVGKNRRQSAALALAKYSPDLFILDDGFQYWQLARDLDIVLLDSRKPFDNGYPLPRGLLREPKENLRRAGMIVITRSDLATQEQLTYATREAQKLAPNAPLFFARHVFKSLRPLNDAAQHRLPEHALIVCAIAQPDSFASLLSAQGIGLTSGMVALPDHATYDDETVKRIKGKIIAEGADSVITTDKDAFKLNVDAFNCPVYSATMTMEFDRPTEFYNEILRKSGLVKPIN